MLPLSRNSLSVGWLFGGAFRASFTGLNAKWCQAEVRGLFLVPVIYAHVLLKVANYLTLGVILRQVGEVSVASGSLRVRAWGAPVGH